MKPKKVDLKHKYKVSSFKKIDYLKIRWEDGSVSPKKLSSYNKWSTNRRYETILIELRIEHYLCNNIMVDLNGNDNLFSKKTEYFSKKSFKNKYFLNAINNWEKHASRSIPKVSHLRKLEFGKKILIYNGLKKHIFKNKFLGIPRDKQKQLIVALENIRNMRNGIAHLNSQEQIYKKFRQTMSGSKKMKLYNECFAIANKIQGKAEN